MADKNFKVKNGLEVGDRDIVTPDGTITLPEGTGTLAKTSDVPSSEIVISEQTGTSYTLQQSDANKLIEFNNSSSITVTIPSNSSVPFTIGTKIDILQTGSGQVNFITTLGSWTTQTSNFGNTALSYIAYGNGIWTAVGSTGQIRTSTDAVTWTTQTSNFSSTNIQSVAYGNGLWVATGDSGQIRTSTDAVTWTTRTSNISNAIVDISYGHNGWAGIYFNGSTFVASVIKSTDAITWTTVSTGLSPGKTGRHIANANSLWVMALSGGTIATSTNATTWTSVTSNFGSTNVEDVRYGNGIWTAVGYAGQIRTSTDTVTWTTRTSNFGSTNIRAVAYGNGLWVATGNYNQTRTSTDGITWTTVSGTLGNFLAIYGGNKFITIGSTGTVLVSSTPFIGSKEEKRRLNSQWSAASLINISQDRWAIVGDLI